MPYPQTKLYQKFYLTEVNNMYDNPMDKRAVALAYDPSKDAAPKVIASGKGLIAQKIIDTAKEESIPVHKDKKLANTLSTLDIGESIPPELYEVVAEILVFVDDMDRIRSKVM